MSSHPTPHPASDTTTPRLVHIYESTAPRVALLCATLEHYAQRRPEAPVPEDMLNLARQVLKPAQRISSATGGPRLLPIHPPVTVGGLLLRARLARSALAAFADRYFIEDEEIGERIWLVPEWEHLWPAAPDGGGEFPPAG